MGIRHKPTRRAWRKAQVPLPEALSTSLLAWYDANRRHLPWRAEPGITPQPYHVWLSEIMLQQTGVTTVIPYFEKFIRRWPTVHDLARAPRDTVLTEWAGLGYYARARNLHKCAAEISTAHGGVFPRELTALLELPGIGPYTAAAISAIAFDLPAPVLDGNIERVISRLHSIALPLPGARKTLRPLAESLIAVARAGDTAQALMDLGSAVCTPRAPACGGCPLAERCLAHAKGIAETLPVKARRPKSPPRIGTAFWLTRSDGAVLLRKRPENGMLGGMMAFPCTPWDDKAAPIRAAAEANPLAYAPAQCEWAILPGPVRHVFTHFKLDLHIYAGRADGHMQTDGIWVLPSQLEAYGLPTLMRKVAARMQAAEPPSADIDTAISGKYRTGA